MTRFCFAIWIHALHAFLDANGSVDCLRQSEIFTAFHNTHKELCRCNEVVQPDVELASAVRATKVAVDSGLRRGRLVSRGWICRAALVCDDGLTLG